MEILVTHTGTPCECFIATSVLKGLRKKYNDSSLYCIAQNEESKKIFKYNKNVKNSYTVKELTNEFLKKRFDLLVNLHPDTFQGFEEIQNNCSEKKGFSFSPDAAIHKEYLYGDLETNRSIFQIYYSLAGLSWKGEGYDFCYYPKSRCKKNLSGISINNANLKDYIVGKLRLDMSKVWHVPKRKDIFKSLDEINRCFNVVTDDFFTLNLALYLRKGVYFLECVPFNTKIELFGSGKVFRVPKEIIQ